MRAPKKFSLVVLAGISLLVGTPAVYAGLLQLTGNIHTVEPNILYRSGQLDGDDLEAFIEAHGIRSILNLRNGSAKNFAAREENLVVATDGVEYHSVPISANRVPTMETMTTIRKIMASAPKPLLVHCKAGADRSGLAAAIFEYAVEKRSAKNAAGQLSFYYGHFPWFWSRTGAMDEAFANFVSHWSGARSATSRASRVQPALEVQQ